MRLPRFAFFLALFSLLFIPSAFAQRGGGSRGGGGGSRSSGFSGGSFRGSISGGGFRSTGITRGIGGSSFRSGFVGGGFTRAGFGFARGGFRGGSRAFIGFGGWGFPYYYPYAYGYPYYGYPYWTDPYYTDPYYTDPYYSYGYSAAPYYTGSAAPAYGSSPPPGSYSSSVPTPAHRDQAVAKPAPADNGWDQPSAPADSPSFYRTPDFYLIALNDHTIQTGVSFYVQGENLHWTTREHGIRSAPLSSVDLRFSEQLNRDRHVQFNLQSGGQ